MLAGGFLAGCGDGEEAVVDSGLESQEGVSLEQGIDAATTPALWAADIPSAGGTTLEYLADAPGAGGIPVDFSLEGPWDLSRDSAQARLTVENIDLEDSPLPEGLTGSGLVSRYSWEGNALPDEYVYQSLDESSWRIHGRSDAAAAEVRELAGVSRILLFPLTPGGGWTDSYTETVDGEQRDLTVAYSVLSYGELSVPAGDFDAFLVQARVTDVGPDDTASAIVYLWFVPGIGRAAEIDSLPGEDDALFSRASAYYRLADYTDGG
ncbi:MAG: hypothetical protein C4534_11425 [Gaiellales bacterium]|nr:MAG: hypothetical protein C4534_11425 [Gaiellales bacterium]